VIIPESGEFNTIINDLCDDKITLKPDEINQLGHSVNLEMFRNGMIKKYKLIEHDGRYIYERLFLSKTQLKHRSVISDDDCIYPLQVKKIPMSDLSQCRTFKYVNGICNFITDSNALFQNDTFFVRNVSDNIAYNGFTVLPAYLVERMGSIIPSPDYSPAAITTYDDFTGPYDEWLEPITTISKDIKEFLIFNGVEYDESSISPNDPFIDADPIQGNWDLYCLIEYINSLSLSDMSINVDRECNHSTVSFIPFPEKLAKTIVNYAYLAFENMDWDEVRITKTASEQLIIEFYLNQQGQYILMPPVMYIDIPVFILGTIGIF
jgi:hypothetical protein